MDTKTSHVARSRQYLGKSEGKGLEKRGALHTYRAYGLHIHSAMPLPELQAVVHRAAPDVSILFSKLPSPPQELPDTGGGVLHTPEGIYFYWSQFGAFLIRDGREILIEIGPDASLQTIHLPLLGCILGVLLHQRGLFTLHASAVSIGGAAVAFIGPKQAGKSTMAAALHARGHALIVDDVLALDLRGRGKVSVLSGFPQLKLWPAAATALGKDPEKLALLHPEVEKRALRPRNGFQKTSLLLNRIYVLSDGPLLLSKPLSAREAFIQLISHSYAARFLGEAGAGPEHFRQCQVLLEQVPVNRLQRPNDLSQLPAIVRLIEDDCNASS